MWGCKGTGGTSPLEQLELGAAPRTLSPRGGSIAPGPLRSAGVHQPQPRGLGLLELQDSCHEEPAVRSAWRLARCLLGPRPEASGGGALLLLRDRGGVGEGVAMLCGGGLAAAHPSLRQRGTAGADPPSIQPTLNTPIKIQNFFPCFFGAVGGVFIFLQRRSKHLLQANFFGRKMRRVYPVLHILTF